MFETDARPVFFASFLRFGLRYFLQLLLSYPVIVIAGMPFSAILSKLGFSGEHPSGKFFAGYEALICLFIGPFVGWTMGRLAPALVPSGRWIWVLPTIVVVPDTVRELLQQQSIPWLPESFFATGSNEGLGVYLFTLPACSAAGYSIGMFFAGMSRRQTKVTLLSSVSRAVIPSLAGIMLFGLFTFLLHNFERARLESWAKVRSVIDRSGLQLSPDVKLLCGSQGISTPRAISISPGTYVESLERRRCDEGQLISADTLPPPPIVGRPGPFPLDRVRVLTGPNAGLEGWVLEYGLLEH